MMMGRVRRILGRLCTPIFLEAFVLTFLAEWGDRSQITTIALAAHKNSPRRGHSVGGNYRARVLHRAGGGRGGV